MQHLHKIITLIFCFMILSISTCFAAQPTASGYIPVDHGKIYYERYGSGDPILVIHGGPGLDQGYLKPQLLELAKNHEVIFYDQRGSGKSLDTVMDRSVINLEQFTDDIEAVRKALGLEHMTVLGHSWGGVLGMTYSIKYPDHLAKLVLVDTVPADIEGIMATSTNLNTRLAPIQEEIAALNDYAQLEKLNAEEINALNRKMFSVYFHNQQNLEKLTLNMTAESARGGFKVQEMMMEDMFINLFPDLKKLTVPTTVIIGEQDFIPLWTSEAIVKAIPGAKLVVIPECGHFPYIEKPVEFFGAIS